MKQTEFQIKARPNLKFRVGKIGAVEMLALQTQIDFKSLVQTETVFNFIFEHIEVEIAGKWIPVKEKNREVYYPVDLEEDMNALHELLFYFLNNVVKPLFVKSNESSQNQP